VRFDFTLDLKLYLSRKSLTNQISYKLINQFRRFKLLFKTIIFVNLNNLFQEHFSFHFTVTFKTFASVNKFFEYIEKHSNGDTNIEKYIQIIELPEGCFVRRCFMIQVRGTEFSWVSYETCNIDAISTIFKRWNLFDVFNLYTEYIILRRI